MNFGHVALLSTTLRPLPLLDLPSLSPRLPTGCTPFLGCGRLSPDDLSVVAQHDRMPASLYSLGLTVNRLPRCHFVGILSLVLKLTPLQNTRTIHVETQLCSVGAACAVDARSWKDGLDSALVSALRMVWRRITGVARRKIPTVSNHFLPVFMKRQRAVS